MHNSSRHLYKKALKTILGKFFVTITVIFIYRFGCYIPLYGIDMTAIEDIFKRSVDTFKPILGQISMFTGGVSRISIFTLGLVPYVTASIIMQISLLTVPSLIELKKESTNHSLAKINTYTYYLTVVLAVLEGYFISLGLAKMGVLNSYTSTLIFHSMSIITFLGSTFFLIWMGSIVTNKGLGNGVSVIIFASIISNIGSYIDTFYVSSRYGTNSLGVILYALIIILFSIFVIVCFEKAQFNLKITLNRGNTGMGGMQTSSMPFKVNAIGVMGPIFASAVLIIPSLLSLIEINNSFFKNLLYLFSSGNVLYYLFYIVSLLFFYIFYTPLVVNPGDIAMHLSKGRASILGVRPGDKTKEYIGNLIHKLSIIAALYVSFVCIVPDILFRYASLGIVFSGISLLICISVLLNIIESIQKVIVTSLYGSMIKKFSFKNTVKRYRK